MWKYIGPPSRSVPGVPLRDLSDEEYAGFVAAGLIKPDGPSGSYWKTKKGALPKAPEQEAAERAAADSSAGATEAPAEPDPGPSDVDAGADSGGEE